MDASCFFVAAPGLFLRLADSRTNSLHRGAYPRVANLNHLPCLRVFVKATVAIKSYMHAPMKLRERIPKHGAPEHGGGGMPGGPDQSCTLNGPIPIRNDK